MTILTPLVGTLSEITGGALHPGTPSGITAGMGLFIVTASFAATPTLTTPPGGSYVNDSPNSAAQQIGVYRRPAVGGDTIPSLQWSGAGYAVAIAFAVPGIDTTFAPVFNTTPVSKAAEKSTASTNSMTSPSVTRTPNVAFTFDLIVVKKDKNSTSNGSVYTNPSGYSSIIALASNTSGAIVHVPSGSNVTNLAVWYRIQTIGTPASISPNTGTAGTIADSSNNMQSNCMSYAPGAGTSSVQIPRPLMRRRFTLFFP